MVTDEMIDAALPELLKLFDPKVSDPRDAVAEIIAAALRVMPRS